MGLTHLTSNRGPVASEGQAPLLMESLRTLTKHSPTKLTWMTLSGRTVSASFDSYSPRWMLVCRRILCRRVSRWNRPRTGKAPWGHYQSKESAAMTWETDIDNSMEMRPSISIWRSRASEMRKASTEVGTTSNSTSSNICPKARQMKMHHWLLSMINRSNEANRSIS